MPVTTTQIKAELAAEELDYVNANGGVPDRTRPAALSACRQSSWIVGLSPMTAAKATYLASLLEAHSRRQLGGHQIGLGTQRCGRESARQPPLVT